MAYKIKESTCIGCAACVSECPNHAISEHSSAFVIDPAKCTECIGYFDEPQCVAICPLPKTCIINPDVPRFRGGGVDGPDGGNDNRFDSGGREVHPPDVAL